MTETKYTDAERPTWVPLWPNTLGRAVQAVFATTLVVAVAVYRGRLELRGETTGTRSGPSLFWHYFSLSGSGSTTT